MIANKVLYEGRVQGVGFRYTVSTIARGFDVFGWVGNLPDGRVELRVKGVTGEVAGFLEAIRNHDLGACIVNESIEAIHEFEIEGQSKFTIKHLSDG